MCHDLRVDERTLENHFGFLAHQHVESGIVTYLLDIAIGEDLRHRLKFTLYMFWPRDLSGDGIDVATNVIGITVPIAQCPHEGTCRINLSNFVVVLLFGSEIVDHATPRSPGKHTCGFAVERNQIALDVQPRTFNL
jgi:hypothetical protein